MTLYFAYGSNMEPRTMHGSCPGARVVGAGRLEGYRLEFNIYSDRWGGGAANLEPDDRAHAWGVIWDIDPGCIDTLDTYVGHPTFFRQERVVVAGPGGESECLTYRIAHQVGFVRPTAEYVSRLRSAIRQQGLPPEALDMLEYAARPPRPHILG